jgi:hypothetical protein
MVVAMLVATMTGCGSDGGGSAGAPAHCDPSQRVGTYLLQYTTISGDCGNYADVLVMWGAPSDPAAGTCTTVASSVSGDGCQLGWTDNCTLPNGANGIFTWTVTQKTVDASVLSGATTSEILSPPSDVCLGTYDVTYTRQ